MLGTSFNRFEVSTRPIMIERLSQIAVTWPAIMPPAVGPLRMRVPKQKNRPKAVFNLRIEFRLRQCHFTRLAISYEADASEAEKHHCPRRWFGDARNSGVNASILLECREPTIDVLAGLVPCKSIPLLQSPF